MKISILGAAGSIGQALSLLLKLYLPKHYELLLYDIRPVINGITLDINHIPSDVEVRGFSGDNISSALINADIVIIAAGKPRKPGMKREDLFNINANIVINLTKQIALTSPNALIGIITNPINSTVVIAAEVLKQHGCYHKNKLFGITTLDIMRAKIFVSESKEKKLNNIHVPVIGGHSEKTILPLLSQIMDTNYNDKEIIKITERIQQAGSDVVNAKMGNGSATLSMGYAATCFCLSLVNALQGEENIVEFAYIEGDGKYAKFFVQPFILGKHGIQEHKNIGLLSIFEQTILDEIVHDINRDIFLGEDFVRKYFEKSNS
ncbi:malate dehydrogenase [Candidatus Pantoea edessiphila]|uniref:Malate dehydrogenase n=1 Tax=Candidatus Pantoea edessiphila TaxID=2044610 RepID=A0A2P5SXP9_9GAMM|nr:malate dehydrogenase [Candidatus Pantoea edessiphila]MBK4775720.1 malate dehydrogenase [Pantoea sp. Edef]PPI87117.1 malate dehydrogenase [Candidatus Pantoea edessiphila]